MSETLPTREQQPNEIGIAQLRLHESSNPNAHLRFLTKCYSPIDFDEDFGHENGNYINNCIFCGRDFLGYKRRVSCKRCTPGSEVLAEQAPSDSLKQPKNTAGIDEPIWDSRNSDEPGGAPQTKTDQPNDL